MLTKHEIRRTAKRILRYAHLPLAIKWTEEDGPAINMVSRTIALPIYLKGQDLPRVEFAVGHEVGHPVVFPKTSRWGAYYTAYAAQLGYEDPHDFENVIGDLFVNDWCMTKTPWQRNFRRRARTFYREVAAGEDRRWSFLARMMRTRLDDLDGKAVGHADEVDEEAYRLLFEDDGTLKDRYEALAVLLADTLKQAAFYCNRQNGGSASSLGPGGESDESEESDEVGDALAGLGSKGVLEIAAEKRLARRELFDLAALNIFGPLMVVEDPGGQTAEEEIGSRQRARWLPGQRLGDLDVRTSIRRHGVLIPGVTTLRRPVGIRRPKNAPGRGTLFLVIDTSGSMDAALDLCVLLAWGAVLGARNRRDRVAIMEFDEAAKYLLPPTEAYGKARQILETLGAGGGTMLGPALDKVIAISKATGRKPTVLVLSDFGLCDEEADIRRQLEQIHALSGRTLLGATPWHAESTLKELASASGTFAFQLNEPTGVREAVSRLR